MSLQSLITTILSSGGDAVLVLSLICNAALAYAVRRLWISRNETERRVTDLLSDLTKTQAGVLNKLVEEVCHEKNPD